MGKWRVRQVACLLLENHQGAGIKYRNHFHAAVQPVCLRIQINPQNKADFQGISPERAFADFLFASTILHLVVMNFVG
uniref:Dolichyl-diphosphooligosaccharide--protein glycosyltransferase subunit DAD1 n=1 Tax=Sus scrofa TaxID=9823 RepID=A0A8D1MUR7_PIG